MIWKIVTKKMRLSMRLSQSHKITIDYKNNIAIYNYIYNIYMDFREHHALIFGASRRAWLVSGESCLSV